MSDVELMKMAQAARENAYAPYSGFKVGAAIEAAGGKIYTDCNVENVSYPAGICAERTALVKAVSEGERKFRRIAVTAAPCGICRQTLAEFGDMDVIYEDNGRLVKKSLKSMLPDAFLKI